MLLAAAGDVLHHEPGEGPTLAHAGAVAEEEAGADGGRLPLGSRGRALRVARSVPRASRDRRARGRSVAWRWQPYTTSSLTSWPSSFCASASSLSALSFLAFSAARAAAAAAAAAPGCRGGSRSGQRQPATDLNPACVDDSAITMDSWP